jgi:hypothetical protein
MVIVNCKLTINKGFDYVPLTPNTAAVNMEFEADVNNDMFTKLKEVRKRHPNQFSCACLNINSFGYAFCSAKELLTTNTVDMLIIAEIIKFGCV